MVGTELSPITNLSSDTAKIMTESMGIVDDVKEIKLSNKTAYRANFTVQANKTVEGSNQTEMKEAKGTMIIAKKGYQLYTIVFMTNGDLSEIENEINVVINSFIIK
ncbi:hypothetical protein [Methanobrevibacter filiformis]|uniref:Uncharacterized protein n=1 Tax=Methanobrevibacter filiformis TaxID=55758 RepID=A0A166FA04_9EURY|nr:hypothetical protein [Methanobrevibacter filiformis]KZX17454.1 hypothetical protein MBFIL_01500 [Methanobrevibacter filiformis]